jgi:G3E family GTPase
VTTTSVTVIGGYLGAGKTTVVNHLLRVSDEPLAVLVNDFGEVSIDVDLIVSHDGTTMELANGCICCSLVDGFVEALATIQARPEPPGRILIEASGVADPMAVAAYAHRPGLRYDGTVVAADATDIRRLLDDKYVGDTVGAQLRGADIVLATKADLCHPDDLSSVLHWLAEVADAPVIAVHKGRVSPAAVTGIEPSPATQVIDTPTQPPPDFSAVTCTADRALARDQFMDALKALPDDVVRVKGIVMFEDDPATWAVHRVGRRLELSPIPETTATVSRVVLMGHRAALPNPSWLTDLA